MPNVRSLAGLSSLELHRSTLITPILANHMEFFLSGSMRANCRVAPLIQQSDVNLRCHSDMTCDCHGFILPVGDGDKVAYCERVLEMVIDLQAQLPTRRFLNTLLDDAHLVVIARRSALAKRGKLFSQVSSALNHSQF